MAEVSAAISINDIVLMHTVLTGTMIYGAGVVHIKSNECLINKLFTFEVMQEGC